jgi:phosphotransferase system enzyme I (PtsI)/phosphotransferase system enzyme I (PtsP)
MASFPQAVLLLMGMGVQTLSMSAYNLPKVKWLIRTIPARVAVSTLQDALRLPDENQIRQLTNRVLTDYGLAELIGPTGS